MKKTKDEELEISGYEEEEDSVYYEYDITTYPSDLTLAGILQLWENDDIVIPDFQREFVWSIKQSSLLIESFLLGLPVPPVFFYLDEENKNLVIDGQQRILSVIFFFEEYFGHENKKEKRQIFRLKGLAEESPFYNKKYSELNESVQRKLKSAVLRAINIRQVGPYEDEENTSMYHIFERLNTGGTPLKSQEIRNCVFRGKIVQVMRTLNTDKNWRLILGKKEPDKHQKDVELILRLLSLSNNVNNYDKPMKEFLNKTMKANRNGNTKKVKEFAKHFSVATQLIIEHLGEKPFHVRGPLNASVLDSVFCTVVDNINKKTKNFKSRFDDLIEDEDYDKTTYESTSDKKVLQSRFEYANDFLIN